MTHHPAVIQRLRRVLRLHRSVVPAGEATTRRQLDSVDPHGLLSMAEIVGPARAAVELRAMVERVGRAG